MPKSKAHHQAVDRTMEFTVLVSSVCVPIPQIYVGWLGGFASTLSGELVIF